MLKNRLLWILTAFVLTSVGMYATPSVAQAPQQKPSQPQTTPPPTAQHPALMRWVSLSTDSRDTVREIIRSEVDNRESFSTRKEERDNLKAVEDEKEREDSDYKHAIASANKEFVRAKKRRDDMTSQFQMVSTDLEESAKGIKTIRATIENLDEQISRYEQDASAQQDSLKRWLQTEKQGEALIAVIYTRGFRDSAHRLEGKADMASAPLIAAHMGTYIEAFTKVTDHVTTADFIRAKEEGTAKWNNEEPIRIELEKNARGTTYLRLKRYELYPFQENKSDSVTPPSENKDYKVALIQSTKDLETFLKAGPFDPAAYDLSRAERAIKSTSQNNALAEEGLNEQIKFFQERMINLHKKIKAAKTEQETQKNLLKRSEENYYKLSLDVAAIRERKGAAERTFAQAQASLQERKRVHESIIIKTALAATKGSQTPAEASAEVILDKLVEVKNDAKTQHSSSATEVTNFQVTGESATQSITEARITAIRLIAFVNEGDSVRVKMAFRVRTVLDEQPVMYEESAQVDTPPAVPKASEPSAVLAADPLTFPQSQPKPVAAPLKPPEEPKPVVKPFKRTYKPLAVKDALGCLFELRSATITKEGLRVLVEVVNVDEAPRKVAFYDDKFGSWNRSSLLDEKNNKYLTNNAYAWHGSQKKLMVDIDSHGRGVEIQPQTSVTMELIFKNIPANVKTIKIHLHPFIYYRSGFRETWQEFDLKMPDMRLRR
ncbi:MAG: hypothetical protein R6W75_12410 [Smithellaceae bacterium]